ncbi:MAG: SDR family oxidoreductase [Flammeovirgaceae bacterium]|jgi:NAD(P)-dependent dehydrogenase (short-subunit alcohol dehydrogenase family)|nr:SDR family oxidoreductase [Flammeovirgaceae bacterium]
MSKLTGKTAIVFAASGAIAGAVAKAFAEEGAFVYVTAKEINAAKAVVSEIENSGGKAKALQVDALNEFQIDLAFQQVVVEQSKIDIVFNGIGIRPSQNQYGTPSALLSFENFLKPLTTIVGSQFLTSRAAAKYMNQTKSEGTILTLTSSLSRSKIPFMAGVTAASTGVEGLTRSLAAEYGMFGIKVICINPTGLGETRTIQETAVANANTIGIPVDLFTAQLAQGYLLKKSPSLKDVGKVAAFLVSDAGATLNSHIVDVDFGNISVI